MNIYKSMSDLILQKQKYFEKILSSDGFLDTWFRYISLHELFTKNIWLDIPVFDYTQLGIGIMYLINPIELEPLTLIMIPEIPTDIEFDLGIWINFEKFDFNLEFPEFNFIFDFLLFNFDITHLFDFISSLFLKAYFGIGKYGISVYDPSLIREFIRSTLWKTRQIRYTDLSFLKHINILQSLSKVHKEVDEVMNARIEFLKSAQKESFIFGLSPLGTGKLSRNTNNYAIITVSDARGNPVQIKIQKLEELIFGLYLGIIPLGFGCIMPRTTVFKFENNKNMPNFFRYIDKKLKLIMNQFTLTPWAYRNYHMPIEGLSPHKSERTTQYHSLQALRYLVEEIISSKIPPDERDTVRIRQYKNAILQLISYPTKRHFWGYNFYKILSDDEFYFFWIEYWVQQGLNRDTLNHLYEVIKPYLTHLRKERLSLGKKVMSERRNLARYLT